ncbi:MAG TPA: class I SAM-dependent methyltransferase [Acidimicrobiales bacterium]
MSTDREHLTTVAYASSGLLADRAALYAARVPAIDLPAFVIDQLADAGPLTGSLAGPVLDIGCGPGWYLAAATARGLPAIGFDLSLGMAREAAARAPSGVADAQALPFRDAVAAAVLLPHMLYHVPDPVAALCEARRVVRPGGTVAVVTNDPSHLRTMRNAMKDALLAVGVQPVASVEAHFDGRNAPAMLAAVFDSVETTPLEGVVRLDRPEPALAHLDSTRSVYPDVADATWQRALGTVRASIAATIAASGAWETEVASVLYLCR